MPISELSEHPSCIFDGGVFPTIFETTSHYIVDLVYIYGLEKRT